MRGTVQVPIPGGRLSRRAVVGGLAGLSFATACDGLPGLRPPRRTARIGYLSGGSQAVGMPLFEAFQDGLIELGWVPGDNLAVVTRFADGDTDRLAAFITEFVGEHFEVLVGGGSTAVEPLVAAAPHSQPIVILHVTDPVGAGLVASLAQPGGNVTGTTSSLAGGLDAKRIEILIELVPQLRRIGYLTNLTTQTAILNARAADSAARASGIEFRVIDVRRIEEIEPSFAALAAWPADAVLVQSFSPFSNATQQIVETAAWHGLPTGYAVRQWVERGGLLYFGPNDPSVYKRGAYFVNRILLGAKPADLPVEQPSNFELIINRTTASALGLTIPPAVAAQVTDWVQ
jgi:putative ABC transport system substrate-binding protein